MTHWSEAHRSVGVFCFVFCARTMALSYFRKYTHMSTQVQTHKRWLDARNSKELPDWPEAGEHDCLFGAVLRGMAHAKRSTGAMYMLRAVFVHRVFLGALNRAYLCEGVEQFNIEIMRAEAVKGATAIFEDTNHHFHRELTAILVEHTAPDNPEDGVHENDFEFSKSEMVAGMMCPAFMCFLWLLSACTRMVVSKRRNVLGALPVNQLLCCKRAIGSTRCDIQAQGI